MRIDLPIRHRRPLSLTSLIDVIFLLFLFFMLSSTFVRFAEVEVSGGGTAGAGSTEAPDILIRLGDDGWQVNGITADADGGLAELRRLQELGAEKAVMVPREGVTSQELVGALERIRNETDLSLTIAR